MIPLIKALLRMKRNQTNDIRLAKLSKIQFRKLKLYIGQEAYDKDGRIIGTIKRIIALENGKALRVEIDAGGKPKKLKASQVYVFPRVRERNERDRVPKNKPLANKSKTGLEGLMYELLLTEEAEIKNDIKYAQGLMPREEYINMKKNIMHRKKYLVRMGLQEVNSFSDLSKLSREEREQLMMLLTYAKIYLFEENSVFRHN